jgi:hypothetical protein
MDPTIRRANRVPGERMFPGLALPVQSSWSMSDGSPLRRQGFGDAFEPLLAAAQEDASWA